MSSTYPEAETGTLGVVVDNIGDLKSHHDTDEQNRDTIALGPRGKTDISIGCK